MLEKNTESQNEVIVSGILNELDIVTGVTKDGRDYVRGTAYVRVDQEINGETVENIVPVKMFSMKLKKGTTEVSKIYERIMGYSSEFKSIAVCEDPAEASRVTIVAKVSENAYYDERTGQIRSNFQLDGNFINKAKPGDVEGAKFVFSGVVIGTQNEVNADGEETGKLFVKLGIVGYGGKLHVVTLAATDSKKTHIENNWSQKDTVKVAGVVNISREVKEFKEDTGFGEPIISTKTLYRNELVITGGSASCLDEDYAYDAADIASLLEDRKVAQEALKNAPKKTASAPAKSDGFGF